MHELGFRIEGDGDGGFRFFRADGVEVEACGAPPIVGAVPEEIEIDVQTSFPRWDGRVPDYHHIVACLATPEVDGRRLKDPEHSLA